MEIQNVISPQPS